MTAKIKQMKIIGIDPGTATTGFAVIEKLRGKITALDYGVITTPARMSPETRLQIIADDLAELLAQHKPKLAVVERLFFAKNQTTAIPVAEARGVVLLTLARHGIQISELTPPEVKLAVTGYGNAKKPQVQKMVQEIFQLAKIPKPDDAADALALAYAGS
jgi:crossover junction endodeoxyribonuclease RuvC